jgi:hypothetical protein
MSLPMSAADLDLVATLVVLAAVLAFPGRHTSSR